MLSLKHCFLIPLPWCRGRGLCEIPHHQHFSPSLFFLFRVYKFLRGPIVRYLHLFAVFGVLFIAYFERPSAAQLNPRVCVCVWYSFTLMLWCTISYSSGVVTTTLPIVQVSAGIELFFLVLIMAEWCIRLRVRGRVMFFHQRRNIIKLVVFSINLVDIIVAFSSPDGSFTSLPPSPTCSSTRQALDHSLPLHNKSDYKLTHTNTHQKNTNTLSPNLFLNDMSIFFAR